MGDPMFNRMKDSRFISIYLRSGVGFVALVVALLAAVIGLQGCHQSSNDANSLVGSPEGAKEVSFKTDDGWNIFADAYVPAGTSKGAVILLHQRDGAASDW